jgi:MFS family permease
MDVVVPNVRAINLLERETMRRVAWRLMPMLMMGYFCAWLDRVNVSFAALTMNKALGFSAPVFGFGAGLFFLLYVVFEVPSNLILNKVGARLWMARILFTWGIIAGLTAFVWNDWSFYVVRVLLGVAEAGFFPGIVLYMTWWFPSAYRARMMAIFLLSSTGSLAIGPVISAQLLYMDGILGLQGWQWLFLIEALPPIIVSYVFLRWLTDRPGEAAWLTPQQSAWLEQRLAAEQAQRESIRHFSLAEAMYNPRVLWLSLVYLLMQVAAYGANMFLPQIVSSFGVSTEMTGLITAIPYTFGIVSLLVVGWHSDRTGERVKHAAVAYLVQAAGLAACILIGAGQPVIMMVALIISTMGQSCISPCFWALPTAMLSGAAAAGGLALINSIGNLGGFLGPYIFGLVKDASGSFTIALLVIALAPVLNAIIVLSLGHDRRLESFPSPQASRH